MAHTQPTYPIFRFQPGEKHPHAPPPELWDVGDSRAALYVQGSPRGLALLERLPEDGFAIVGTRDPQPRAVAFVRRIVRDIADAGLIVVSGFARGTDAAAHEAALEEGLPTIAIVAGGLIAPYPVENRPLRDRILDSGGLMVSEHPPDRSPYPKDFLDRNRLIAGWCKATWIAQAGTVSGALNTARHARDFGRPVYVTTSFPEDPAFAGNHHLLTSRDGAEETFPLFHRFDLRRSWPRLGKAARPGARVIPLRGSGAQHSEDEQRLAQEVRRATVTDGAAEVQELLNWATRQGWSPQQFFLALRRAIAEGLVQDRGGLLTAY